MVKEIQGRKTSPRVSVLGWDIMTTLCVPWSQSSQASQRLGAAGSSCAHCWQLKDNGTWKRERPSGQKDEEGFFFLLLSILHASWLNILTTWWLRTYARAQDSLDFVPACVTWGERYASKHTEEFSFHEPLSLYPFPSAHAVARHPSCRIAWGVSITPRGAGHPLMPEPVLRNKQLLKASRPSRYLGTCGQPRGKITDHPRAARQTSHEEEWKQAQYHLRCIRKLPARAVQWCTHTQSGRLSHRRLIVLLFNGCTVEKKKRLSSHVACCNWLLQQLTVRPWQLSG